MSLETVRLTSERDVDDILTRAMGSARDNNTNFIDVLLDSMGRQDMLEKLVQQASRTRTRSRTHSASSCSDRLGEDDDDDDDDEQYRRRETIDRSSIILSHSDANTTLVIEQVAATPMSPPKDTTRRTGVSFISPPMGSLAASDANKSKRTLSEDPSENIEKLPIYLRGGEDVVGFGSLLGHALSLLLTARHGLKESELWSMLAVIQDENRKISKSSEKVDDDARSLVGVCYGYRGALEDFWRSYDPKQLNVIARKHMLLGMKKTNPEFTDDDLTVLLDVTGVIVPGMDDIRGSNNNFDGNLSPERHENSHGHSRKLKSAGARATQVPYLRLLEAIVRCEKNFRYLDNKSKTASKVYLVDDDMEAGLEFKTQDPMAGSTFDDDNSVPSAMFSVGSRYLFGRMLIAFLCNLLHHIILTTDLSVLLSKNRSFLFCVHSASCTPRSISCLCSRVIANPSGV